MSKEMSIEEKTKISEEATKRLNNKLISHDVVVDDLLSTPEGRYAYLVRAAYIGEREMVLAARYVEKFLRKTNTKAFNELQKK